MLALVSWPSHVRLSAFLIRFADVGYIIWDTVDARRSPAASIEVKVGKILAGPHFVRLGADHIFFEAF